MRQVIPFLSASSRYCKFALSLNRPGCVAHESVEPLETFISFTRVTGCTVTMAAHVKPFLASLLLSAGWSHLRISQEVPPSVWCYGRRGFCLPCVRC